LGHVDDQEASLRPAKPALLRDDNVDIPEMLDDALGVDDVKKTVRIRDRAKVRCVKHHLNISALGKGGNVVTGKS